jgi:hypothetical protein
MKVFVAGTDHPDHNKIALYEQVRRTAANAGSTETRLYHDLAETTSDGELFAAMVNGIAWADVMFVFIDEDSIESGIQIGIADSRNTIVVAISKRGSLMSAKLLGLLANSGANVISYSDPEELGRMVAALVCALPTKG